MLYIWFIIEELWVQKVPHYMQRLMKLNLPPLINDFEDFFVLPFISIKTFRNCILSSIHGLIDVSHRSFFSPSTKWSTQTRGLETFKQNTIVFQNEGIRTILAIVFPFFSFAHLLSDWFELVNIFLKLFFCSCNYDNVMKTVANRVLVGLSNSLCLVNRLIMLSIPKRL